MTDKFKASRILAATATLLVGEHAEPGGINSVILGRAAYLIQNIWQAQFPKMKRKCDINDFWRRVQKTAALTDDIFELIIVWDETINPPGCLYGENVQIQITTEWSINAHHLMKITAKKG